MSKKIFLYNIFFFLVLLFLFLEFIFPFFFNIPKLLYKFHDDRTVTFLPNKNLYSHTDEFRIKFKTNEFGFNDYKFDDQVDILILGDSYVQAIEVDRKKHFAEYIKDEFNVKIAKIGMSGYGNSHYFANYLKFKNLLNPKLVIIINATNDLKNNFCDNNTQFCIDTIQLCNVTNDTFLKSYMKFLKINEQNDYKFIYTKKETRDDLKIKILRNFIDKFQSYYSLRFIYSAYLKSNIINNNKKINKTLQSSSCQNGSDNFHIKEYYKKINSIIFNEIVKVDKKKLLFVNVKNLNPNDDDIAFFVRKSFKDSDLTYINFDGNNKANFTIDGHWNEFGHKLVADKIINFIKKNYNSF
jgi:hypothetical protein